MNKQQLAARIWESANNMRDISARKKMRDLVNSDANKVSKVFSTLFKE